jgi:hypothetical protein
MTIISTLKVVVEGKEFAIAGGDFHERLSAVKAIAGRRCSGPPDYIWSLPLTLEEVREVLSEYQILGDEDEVLDAEIAEIQKLQGWILEDEAQVLAEAQSLDAKVKGYSFRSKSSVKASLARDAACLHHAINSAKLPVEKLAEIQIKGMKAACSLMGWV